MIIRNPHNSIGNYLSPYFHFQAFRGVRGLINHAQKLPDPQCALTPRFARCRAEIWGARSKQVKQAAVNRQATNQKPYATCHILHQNLEVRTKDKAPTTQHPSRRSLAERMSTSVSRCRLIAGLPHELPRKQSPARIYPKSYHLDPTAPKRLP